MRIPARCFALLVALLQVPVPAFAASKPSVAVPPIPGQADDRARMAIAKALRDSGRVTVIETSAVDRYLSDRRAVAAKAPSSSQAAEKLAQGQAAYNELRLKDAIARLTEAKVAYRKQLSEEGAFQGLRATQFHLAMAYLAQKDQERAKEELRQVITLDPERETRKLSERLYPPNIRALYQTVRKEVLAKEKGDVEVISQPAGALIYLDGKPIGVAPARVAKTPVGEHFVKAVLSGFEPYFSSKFLVEGANRFELSMKPMPTENVEEFFQAMPPGQPLDHKRAAFLDEMGVALGVDVFVFLVPGKAAVQAQLYDQRSQEVSPPETGTSPDSLVPKLLSYLDADGYVSSKPKGGSTKSLALSPASGLTGDVPSAPAGTLSDQIQRPPSPAIQSGVRPWYENPWIWAAIGGVVLVGGGVFLFTDVGKKDASNSSLTFTIPSP